jgi:hypothetical protein
MADLIIKPSAVADEFKMNDANSSANTILTVEGQTDSAVTTAGRIIYGKGVNETLGTASQAGAVVTIDLATGTFFEHTLVAAPTSWKILHLPASGTIAAWVVKITNNSSKVTWDSACWTGAATSTWDNAGTWSTTTPVFHWVGGTDHVQTDTNSSVDIVSFWTKGGATPVIYSTISGQAFAT